MLQFQTEADRKVLSAICEKERDRSKQLAGRERKPAEELIRAADAASEEDFKAVKSKLEGTFKDSGVPSDS